MKFTNKIKGLLGVLLVTPLLFVLGCGSASNNDQGVSFSLIGFFDAEDETQGLSGLVVPLTENTGDDNEPGVAAGVQANVGLQNNLAGQGIRVQRLFISYYVPGAEVQPPSTSFPLAGLLGPGVQTDPPTSLPAGYPTNNQLNADFYILTPEIRSWLAFNRQYLPEPPFTMEASVYATGLTTSGNRLDTNQESLFISIVPDINIIPGGNDGSDDEDAAIEEDEGIEDDEEFIE